MNRKSPMGGPEREVTHYYVVSKDIDVDNNNAEKDTYRFDIYEHDPAGKQVQYTRQGELTRTGLDQVVHSRSGLQSAEVAEQLALTEGLARNMDVINGKRDNRADNG